MVEPTGAMCFCPDCGRVDCLHTQQGLGGIMGDCPTGRRVLRGRRRRLTMHLSEGSELLGAAWVLRGSSVGASGR